MLCRSAAWMLTRSVCSCRVFLSDRRAAHHKYLISLRGMAPMLDYLRGLGAIGQLGPRTPVGPVEKLLAEYRTYLRDERGMAALSVDQYCGHARVFLSGLPPPMETALRSLSAGQVTDFLVSEVGRRRTWSAKNLVTALRALLRFLHITGRIPCSLVAAVPTVAGWGLGTLPRAVSAAHVTTLLDSCDRTTARGRRDYAILMLLSRLGLRNGEIAHLRLDDIDWRTGQIMIRGKGSRYEAMPLPDDVGRALVDYLVQGRPPNIGSRTVFVIDRAPYSPLSLSAVTSIVVAACDRGGVARSSPHRLRHFVASDLLARGAPLAEVGQLLRHNAESTTAVYAKLDHRALGALVRPWPGTL